MDRIEVSLALLRDISTARRVDDAVWAAQLTEKLQALDLAHGYDRAGFHQWLIERRIDNANRRHKRFAGHERVMQAGERGRNG
jgi:hypothetical protein